MSIENQIQKEIEGTLEVLNSVEEVKINYFFKDKVLQKIALEKEKQKENFYWFTPQLQMAFLLLILALNISVIFYTFSSKENSSEATIEIFAQEYLMQSENNLLGK